MKTKKLAESSGISRRDARRKKAAGLNTPEKIADARAANGRIRTPPALAKKIGMQRLRLLTAQADQAEIDRAQRRNELILFSEVDRFLQHIVGTVFFGELEKLKEHWPGVLKGMDEISIHAKCTEAVEQIKGRLRSELTKFAKQ